MKPVHAQYKISSIQECAANFIKTASLKQDLLSSSGSDELTLYADDTQLYNGHW